MSEEKHQREPIDWGHFLRRKDRPLPPQGCSVAFYIFLFLLLAGLAVCYIFFRYSVNG